MWKTGKVAAEFKRDPKTIKRIVDDYSEFFTQDAREDETGTRVHRTFHMADLLVIHSVLRWEYAGTPPQVVKDRLKADEREQDIPPGFRVIEGETAMTVYAEMSQLRTLLQQRDAEIERLRADKVADTETIITLNRQIAVLEYKLEQAEADDEK